MYLRRSYRGARRAPLWVHGEILTAEAAAPAAAAPAAAASMMLSINRLHVSYQQVQLIGEVSILQNPTSSITFN